jgi:hypothetical protein
MSVENQLEEKEEKGGEARTEQCQASDGGSDGDDPDAAPAYHEESVLQAV